jgi:hypothetical protein
MNARLAGLRAVLFTAVLGFCSAAVLAAATINVPAGGNFQTALNSAHAGDVIMLAAGAAFQGPFVLPVNSGSSYITIRTSAADSALPPAGTRIDPSYSGVLPKLVADASTDLAIISTVAGSNHFMFIGVEITPTSGASLFQLVQLALGSETSLSQLPTDFVFDRCYLHGDPKNGTRRGIAMNAPNVTSRRRDDRDDQRPISQYAVLGDGARLRWTLPSQPRDPAGPTRRRSFVADLRQRDTQ